MFSTDGEAKIGQNISVGLKQVLDMVKSTTGVDFQETLERAASSGREVRRQADSEQSSAQPAPWSSSARGAQQDPATDEDATGEDSGTDA